MSPNMPSPAALWPVWRQPAEQALRAMLGELAGLAITGGEASVRLSPGAIEGGRWLAGFSPAGVSAERLMGLPERLAMPAEGAERFRSQWRHARQIYLAVEQTDTQVIAKVYFEHALPAPDLRTRAPNQRQVALQIESCKWRVDAPAPAARHTEYWRMSGLDGAATVALLRETRDLAPAAQEVHAAVALVLENALRAAPGWQGHRLLVVREPDTGRRGVSVRFYGSELRASAVLNPLSNLFAAWGLSPGTLSGPLSVRATQELGWLHAGLDARARPYLTVYGALNRADTRAVLMRAGVTRSATRAALQEY